MIDPNNLPKEGKMREELRKILPKLKPRKRKLVKIIVKGLYKAKKISKEQHEEAMAEFEAIDKK